LQSNPMRILDSKDVKDIKICASAHRLLDNLNAASKSKFAKIEESLTDLGLAYKINPLLVRGLDYYSHLVFEFRTQALGAQDAVLSGGRYDGLCETMGGPYTPAVGWAAGVERLAMLLSDDPVKARPLSLIPIGEKAEAFCRKLAFEWRGDGMPIDMAYAGNMSSRLKKAVNQKAIAALIVGDNELSAGEFSLKILDSGEQKKVLAADLKTTVSQFFCQKR